MSMRVMSNVSRVESALHTSGVTGLFRRALSGLRTVRPRLQRGHGARRAHGQLSRWPRPQRSKTPAGDVTVLYATESMRLTTRLLDLASWLLIRRALKEGEITEEEAQKKRRRVKLQAFGRPSHVKGYSRAAAGSARA